jgi:O-antigen/teichoic acid export membrane protein
MILIGRKDVIWNYAATFLKAASFMLLLPFVLRMMSPEIVGLWIIFITITSFSALVDFGFNPSFSRNVSYVFSGIRSLKVNGFESVEDETATVDYRLLKGLIKGMRWLYLRLSLVLFLLISTIGTYYIHTLLKTYEGNHQEVYIAWGILCIINIYNLFTLYYESLLQGRGLVKRSKQIYILGQAVYISIAIILIMSGKGLIALVAAQALSVIIIRVLSHYSFFTREIREKLDEVESYPQNKILKAIYPNAVKMGLTSLGGFTVQRSAIVIGSLYLPLSDIASYGVTIQLISVLSVFGLIYTSTYTPKIGQLRIIQKLNAIKELYIKGELVLILTFIVGGTVLLLFGQYILNIIGSQTQLLPQSILFVALLIAFLESNHALAGGILLTGNEVPFFKASLIAGILTLFLLVVLFNFTNMRIWAMILSPGIAHLYNNWKWPYEVFIQLKITKKDISDTLKILKLRNF